MQGGAFTQGAVDRDRLWIVIVPPRAWTRSASPISPVPSAESAPPEPSYDIEAALPTEVDVDQGDVRSELRGTPDCVGTVRYYCHDHDALTVQQTASGRQEQRAVIDNQATERHGPRMASDRSTCIPASWTLLPRQPESGSASR